MQTLNERFEAWARAHGFSEALLAKAASGDYANIQAHYAWEGFKAASNANMHKDMAYAAYRRITAAGFGGAGLACGVDRLIKWATTIQERYTRFINGEGGHYCQICGKTLDGYEPPSNVIGSTDLTTTMPQPHNHQAD